MKVAGFLSTLLLVLFYQDVAEAIWFPWYFYRFASSYGHPSTGHTTGQAPSHTNPNCTPPPKHKITCPPGMRPKNSTVQICDDNPVLMQLARLYLVSPERIVLLLSQSSLQGACNEVNDVVTQIDSATRMCRMTDDNIYRKLTNGLKYFKSEICDGGNKNTRKRSASLTDAHECIRELRSDMIECEAPADWYEVRNASRVCKIFNDILNCYYTRAALLCGTDVARQLRSFAGDSMQHALLYDCKISKHLPHVDDPMTMP